MPRVPDEVRDCVRAILITEEQEILLIEVRHPGDGRRFWITPGGGIDVLGKRAVFGLR